MKLCTFKTLALALPPWRTRTGSGSYLQMTATTCTGEQKTTHVDLRTQITAVYIGMASNKAKSMTDEDDQIKGKG